MKRRFWFPQDFLDGNYIPLEEEWLCSIFSPEPEEVSLLIEGDEVKIVVKDGDCQPLWETFINSVSGEEVRVCQNSEKIAFYKKNYDFMITGKHD